MRKCPIFGLVQQNSHMWTLKNLTPTNIMNKILFSQFSRWIRPFEAFIKKFFLFCYKKEDGIGDNPPPPQYGRKLSFYFFTHPLRDIYFLSLCFLGIKFHFLMRLYWEFGWWLLFILSWLKTQRYPSSKYTWQLKTIIPLPMEDLFLVFLSS